MRLTRNNLSIDTSSTVQAQHLLFPSGGTHVGGNITLEQSNAQSIAYTQSARIPPYEGPGALNTSFAGSPAPSALPHSPVSSRASQIDSVSSNYPPTLATSVSVRGPSLYSRRRHLPANVLPRPRYPMMRQRWKRWYGVFYGAEVNIHSHGLSG